jgi:hypothetical protein
MRTTLPRQPAGTKKRRRYLPCSRATGFVFSSYGRPKLYAPKPCCSQFEGTGIFAHAPLRRPAVQ